MKEEDRENESDIENNDDHNDYDVDGDNGDYDNDHLQQTFVDVDYKDSTTILKTSKG